MSLPADSRGGLAFESLPLTPPRPKSKADDAPPASPRSIGSSGEVGFSFPRGPHQLRPSHLGSLSGHAHPDPSEKSRFPDPLEESRLSRLVHSQSPASVVGADKWHTGDYSRSSSFNFALDGQNRIVGSPPASDKPPRPIFTRSGSSKSLSRNLSSKDVSSTQNLNRLLSMEKGERWRSSPHEQGGKNDSDLKLDTEVLESKVQYEGSLSWWKMLKNGTPGTKKLLALIILTFTYSATEFLVGLFTGRMGLVSDSFHLTFGCGVLTFSLFAMVVSKSTPSDVYTYGYNRLEVLAAFTNALFLLFLSFSLAVEALHAFVQDESEHRHYLIVSAVANLTVNLLGVWFFRSYTRVRVVYRKAEDMNNHSICLHVLSDSIRSAGVVLASWLLALGVKYAETLCLGLVAVAVFLTVMPLFKASAGVLLQMAPPGISRSAFSKCERQVELLEEVIDCYKARFWDVVPGSVVGTLVIQIQAGADEQKILKHVHSIYNDIGVKDLTVELELKPQSR